MKHYDAMNEISYWDCVKHGCEKLGVPNATFRTWKSRGRVSREQAIPLYQALVGTKYKVSLTDLATNQK